jgi:hypothetical protein
MRICAYLDRNLINIERSVKHLRYEYIAPAHVVYLLVRKNNDTIVERTCEVGASLVPANIVAFGMVISLFKNPTFGTLRFYTEMKNNMAGMPNIFMPER